MGSHSVTCHPTEVNAPRLTPVMQPVLDFPIPEGWQAELTYIVDLIAPRPGVEPATFRSRVRRRTAAPPRQLGTARSPLAADDYTLLVTDHGGTGPHCSIGWVDHATHILVGWATMHLALPIGSPYVR